jgi:inner membrane protein
MDPVTHMLVGATVGQIVAGRKVGFKRAALWGAVAAEVPDVDVIVSALTVSDPLHMIVSHRGVTHALWFGPIVGVLAGWWLARSTDPPRAQARTWIALLTAALLSHPLVDFCTHYGTQLLSPFSNERFALPALPIVEPFYSGMLMIGLLAMLLFARRDRSTAVVRAGVVSLLVSSAYVAYGWRLNEAAVEYARKDLVAARSEVAVVYAFPTLLQMHLRRVVARTPSEDLVGFVSMARPCPIVWARYPRDESPLVETLRRTEEGQIFEWFATGLTAAYSDARRVFVNDLRYGLATDVLRGNWRLEADVGPEPSSIGTPRFVQSPRPTVSVANVVALFREAYPRSCETRAGTLDF